MKSERIQCEPSKLRAAVGGRFRHIQQPAADQQIVQVIANRNERNRLSKARFEVDKKAFEVGGFEEDDRRGSVNRRGRPTSRKVFQ